MRRIPHFSGNLLAKNICVVIMMSPDINEAAVDKTTLEESTMAESEKAETVAAETSSQAESAPSVAETTNPSAENTDPSELPTQVNTALQVEHVSKEQSEENKNQGEQMKLAQQPEASVQENAQPADQSAEQPAAQTETNTEKPVAEAAKPEVRQVESTVQAAQEVKFSKRPYIDITPYLKLMVEREGSDMYFTCGAKVQIKINGLTVGIGNNVLPPGAVNDILPGILNERQMAEFEEEMELDTAFSLDNVGRFRINVFRQRGEVAIVIRQIKAQIPTVEDLQLPSVIENLIMEPRGLIIIAGATGTGKSTTVASMIDYRNTRRSGHILTIEDPIEFIHDHKRSIVNQREVGLDTKSFKEALRRAMREAPDVIMIGEIRDAETMSQALSYADTGHLCIATLHATNTIQCMERIISMFPEGNRDQLFSDLSLNLRAIVCQRLLIDVNKTRVPATEVLFNEPQVKKLIHDGQIHKLKEVLEKAPPESPLHSFDNDMLRLYKAKKITMDEALSHADEPNHFKLKVNLGGSGGSFGSSGDDIY
jgi:twitching motility protein PilU